MQQSDYNYFKFYQDGRRPRLTL